MTVEAFQDLTPEQIQALTLEDFKALQLPGEIISLLPPEKLKALNSNDNFYTYNVERVGNSLERAADAGSTYVGKMVNPEVEVIPSVSAIGTPPTAYNRSTVSFKFGDQKLHEGDYFFVETENVAIEFPSKYYTEIDGKKYVIANIEKSGYETDIIKATDIGDPSRYDLNSDDLLTSTEIQGDLHNVEGLKNIEAKMDYSISKETIFATENRQSTFKINVNDSQKYETPYTIPAFNESVRHKGNYNEDPDVNKTNKNTYRSFDFTTWDYRPKGANATPEALSEIGFFKDLTAEGFGTLSGQLYGAPKGFKLTISSKFPKGQPGAFTFPADKMRVGERLPVKWAPFSKNGERQANSKDGKLYVTPEGMYYVIESISADGRSMTLNFYGLLRAWLPYPRCLEPR
ncbi:hypothetical protein [Streptococcus marmotae]|uniref:hypothetical protein n=1 Tax=Streptococcus marmotae TaxID=1825069 RepID=UPI0008299699|nr:hypothetical protein [Streptococcus marmotae]